MNINKIQSASIKGLLPMLCRQFREQIMRFKYWYDFQAYQLKNGMIICPHVTDLAPSRLEGWKMREGLVRTLRDSGYVVKTHPNPFRLNAYKEGEEFIIDIDCPETIGRRALRGERKPRPVFDVLPVKWVRRETVDSWLIIGIPNRSGMVGVEDENAKHFSSAVNLMLKWGDVRTPFGNFKMGDNAKK